MLLFVGKLKKFLGVLTDILLIGRKRGWWQHRDRLGRLKKKADRRRSGR